MDVLVQLSEDEFLACYTLAVADRLQYESGETYGGLALVLGIAVAILAWVVYPRHRS